MIAMPHGAPGMSAQPSAPGMTAQPLGGPLLAGDGERVLTTRGLTVTLGSTKLVDGIDLRIGRGDRVGLIGESGSGKTLTALAIMGLLPEYLSVSGSVLLRGADHDLIGADERQVSRLRGGAMTMVFQEPMTALNPTMRIGDQVAEVMIVHRTQRGRRAIREAVVRLLEDVRLPDPAAAARAYPHQLSGGQRQRVGLAIALANNPNLLICDEPTTALDVTVQANVLDLIVRGVAARDAGLLFITHDLAVVATVCDKVAVMYGGRIVETGEVADVFTRPRHDYTKALLAASDLSVVDEHGRLRAGGVRVEGASPDGVGSIDRSERAGSDGSAGSEVEVTAEPRVIPPAEPSVGTMGGPIISVRDLVRTYQRSRTSLFGPPAAVEALRGVTFDVARGERLGIVGESGCGKTTLLRLIAALDAPTSGQVTVDGVDLTGLPERRLRFLRERMQLVFQDPMASLDPRMRIHESVAEPLLAQDKAAPRERIQALLRGVGIEPEAAHRYPHQFSGGQRQRISIARAVAPDPRILVADEPVSALDVSVRARILNLMTDLVDDLGLTLIFVSHDLSVVRHVCERIIVMKAGEIVEEGPTEAIYQDARHPYTRRLLASIPTISRGLAGVSAADLAAARKEEYPV